MSLALSLALLKESSVKISDTVQVAILGCCTGTLMSGVGINIEQLDL